MPKLTINDLREQLFDTLKALRDPDKPMEIARAKTIAEVAQVIVDSAKVEVEFLKATDAVRSTDFLPAIPARPALPPSASQRQRDEQERLERIAKSPGPSTEPGETVTINGEEFEPVWDGARGKAGASLSSWR